MDLPRAEIESTSIVLVGSFNPAIFSPLWFEHTGLLPKSEADAAQVQVISPVVAQFSVGWLVVQVLPERCTLTATSADRRPLLQDLALGTFRLLYHTPVAAAGFNHDAHFALGSPERYHRVGHALVPKAFLEGRMVAPGTRLVVIEGERDDGREGRVNLQVEPSLSVPNGLFVRVNDHFQLSTRAEAAGAAELIALLLDAWDESIERAHALMAATLAVK